MILAIIEIGFVHGLLVAVLLVQDLKAGQAKGGRLIEQHRR
jgi:hypothetical protein